MDELVLIAGAGTMGAGIALVTAKGGYRVEVAEPDAATRERARARIARASERSGDPA
ncbi:MAG: 3-hydroxybutyryl-CoA dehydrogenase, partial [Candidatus Eremiobacteraeota bacterium]|nr:3-hydroxybutyryl-CoA dehydrogenase [Candidatus Eremiobacteraeota bacterium]